MKKIYLLGFRIPECKNEPALIRAGHVGFAFEDEPVFIFGFHPISEALEAVGGEEAAIEWLKESKSLDGTLQADRSIFVRAYELHQPGARTEVWQITLELPDKEYERVRAQTLQWYTEKIVFTYAFP